jgi:hypothetical protein
MTGSMTGPMIGGNPRRTLRGRAGRTIRRLASGTHILARAGLREIKGKNPGILSRGTRIAGLLPKLSRR